MSVANHSPYYAPMPRKVKIMTDDEQADKDGEMIQTKCGEVTNKSTHAREIPNFHLG